MSDKTIKILRAKLDMTQKEFAKVLKVTQESVSGWERGAFHPSIKMMNKIIKFAKSKGIEVRHEDLMGE